MSSTTGNLRSSAAHEVSNDTYIIPVAPEAQLVHDLGVEDLLGRSFGREGGYVRLPVDLYWYYSRRECLFSSSKEVPCMLVNNTIVDYVNLGGPEDKR